MESALSVPPTGDEDSTTCARTKSPTTPPPCCCIPGIPRTVLARTQPIASSDIGEAMR